MRHEKNLDIPALDIVILKDGPFPLYVKQKDSTRTYTGLKLVAEVLRALKAQGCPFALPSLHNTFDAAKSCTPLRIIKVWTTQKIFSTMGSAAKEQYLATET